MLGAGFSKSGMFLQKNQQDNYSSVRSFERTLPEKTTQSGALKQVVSCS